ncbi:CTP synthase [Candidatus Microgenomates bacterium]|nr:CTP synthase [Candidatus Microgenomates bacterium]
MLKFIIVSGGVLSGLGKGITAASIGLLLKSRGIKVTAMKCDMYLNEDAGTMNPIEHGEVFVTDDGLETDQDLGHYERFLDIDLTRSNYTTNGQLYRLVLDKERALDYGGKCVEPYHHIPPEIINKWKQAGLSSKSDVVIVELGGTVGEYEGLLFFESVRRLKLESPDDTILVHVGYLPAPPSIGELKSKPLQQSVSQLNSLGLSPDFIVARSEIWIDEKRKEKIALASGVKMEDIIAAPDVESIYEVPLVLKKQNFDVNILKKLGLKKQKQDLGEWNALVKKINSTSKKTKIGVIGKYQKTGDYVLSDSYVCVVEAIKHAGWKLGIDSEIIWIDSEALEKTKNFKKTMKELNGIIIPQGWGKRGVEGKIKAIKYARENDLPFLGLCFGMQMAVIEYGRNVLGLKSANSMEVNPKTKYPVIHTMADQVKLIKDKKYGGTIRLGAYPCKIKKNSKLYKIYNSKVISERHRHRYEFNNKFKKQFEKNGMVFSGMSPNGKLVEVIELPGKKFFVGVQFHPEYKSRPTTPHPIFVEFLKSVKTT